MSENINKLLQAKTRLSLREPFFSSILFRFPMEATNTVPYAAVTPRGRILYNPEAIEKLSVEEIVFLLCHEVLHIAFSHSLRRGEREHYLFNIASDAVINEMLIELEIGKFIDSGVRLKGAQSRTAEDIYDEIYEKIPAAKLLCDIIYSGDQNAGGLKNDPLAEARKIYGESVEDAELRDIENCVKMAVAEAITKQKMMETRMGSAMGHLITLLEEYVLVEKLPWYELLGRFMTKFVSQNETWRRPNKRFSDVYLPSVNKEAQMGSLVIGIDTSGSISDEMLAAFGKHLFDVIEECKPEEIFVLWCDYKIQKIEQHQWEDVPFKLSAPGRGGTNMCEIVNWVNKNTPEADACVIFTDGYTPYPQTNEESVPTLWVITSKNTAIPEHINRVHFEME